MTPPTLVARAAAASTIMATGCDTGDSSSGTICQAANRRGAIATAPSRPRAEAIRYFFFASVSPESAAMNAS